MADRLLRIEKVAELLDCSVRQVRRLVEWKHLAEPCHPSPGQVRWLASDVEEYMKRLKYKALPPIPDTKGGKKRRTTRDHAGPGVPNSEDA